MFYQVVLIIVQVHLPIEPFFFLTKMALFFDVERVITPRTFPSECVCHQFETVPLTV